VHLTCKDCRWDRAHSHIWRAQLVNGCTFSKFQLPTYIYLWKTCFPGILFFTQRTFVNQRETKIQISIQTLLPTIILHSSRFTFTFTMQIPTSTTSCLAWDKPKPKPGTRDPSMTPQFQIHALSLKNPSATTLLQCSAFGRPMLNSFLQSTVESVARPCRIRVRMGIRAKETRVCSNT
jgi:hypothetical protein